MNKSTNTFMFMLFIIFQQQIFEKNKNREKKEKKWENIHYDPEM